VKEGTVSGRDPEAGWTQKNGESHFGYKAHVAVDQGSELIRKALFTSAHLHDSQPAAQSIRGDERAVYGHKAYASQALRARLAAVPGCPQQAAEAVAELVQQGGRRHPRRRRGRFGI
jgi:IS5 family transposase